MKKLTLITVIIISFLITGLLNAQNISLYCVGNDTTCGTNKSIFYKIDAFSSTATTIDTMDYITGVTLNSSTFDQSSSHYIFFGTDLSDIHNVYVLDTNGNIVSNSPFNDALFGFQYDMNYQILYALQPDTINFCKNLITLNPNNGNITHINNLDYATSSGTNTFDSNNGRYIFYGNDNSYNYRLFTINAQNGTLEYNPLVEGCYISELEYDVNVNKLYGLYRDTANLQLFYFTEINIVNADITILNPLHELEAIYTSASVYDQNSGTYIFIGVDTLQVARIYLIDASNGQIISNSPIEENVIEIECDNTRFAKNFYTSVNEETIFNNLAIYPNPSQGVFTLGFTVENPQDVNIQVVNNIGQVVFQKQHKNYKGIYSGKIDLSSYANGAYILNITVGENSHTENITVLR